MKNMTLYKVDIESNYSGYKYYYQNKGLEHGEVVLSLCEISNMPNHYAVVNNEGKIIYGLHSNMFIKLQEEDI